MKSPEISAFLNQKIEAGDFPSAIYLVGEKSEIKFADALGFAVQTNDAEIPAKLETIYDLASLTKPLVTGLLCAKLIESGEIKFADKISKFFSEFDTSDKRGITIENLFAHTSGFPAWKPFYLNADAQNPQTSILTLIAAEPLKNEPNIKVTYSDFNFITLGFLLEKLHGKPLDEIAKDEIFEPLKLSKTFFNPPTEFQSEAAACEFGNFYEKQVCQESGFDVDGFAWREDLIWGVVHDGNCWFLNGVSGHAGLFSNVLETFEIAKQFLVASTQLLSFSEHSWMFQKNFTKNLNEARSLAFELAATKDSTASAALSPNSFGHLGFTGTSLWIEPETERVFILLTNRTHRPLPFVNINSTRRKFHEMAINLLAQN